MKVKPKIPKGKLAAAILKGSKHKPERSAKAASKKKLLPAEVDALANKYEVTQSAIKDYSGMLNRQKEYIKDAAERYGESNGKEVLIDGNRAEIGYAEVTPSPVFDPNKAKQLLASGIYKRCLTEMFDESKLAQLVKQKVVKHAVFLKMFTPAAKQKRIVVRFKSQKKKADYEG